MYLKTIQKFKINKGDIKVEKVTISELSTMPVYEMNHFARWLAKATDNKRKEDEKMNTEKLQKKMAALKITNAELSRQVGITEAYVSQIINGLKVPSCTIGKRIADTLQCSLDDLL